MARSATLADLRAGAAAPGVMADAVSAALGRVVREGAATQRCLAARALGRIGRPGSTEPLVEALLDADEDVRADAAGALGRFPDARAAQQLLENLLGDPSGEVKLCAIEALAVMGCRDAVPWLRRLLAGRDEEIVWDEDALDAEGWDDWVDIQVAALRALAGMGAKETVPDIVRAIGDEFGQDLTEVGFSALAMLGDAGADALAGYLDDASPRRRRRAASVLGGLDGDIARAAMARAIRDPSEEVRLAAAQALAARDPADERLAGLMRDPRGEVRAEAVRLCGSRHPDRLVQLLDDPAPAVQAAALEAMTGAVGMEADEALSARLRARLGCADPALSAAAAKAFAALVPQEAAGDLVAQLADRDRPQEVRLAAIHALGGLDDGDATNALAEAIGDETRQIRIEAMAALAGQAGRAWPNRAGDALLAALRGELVPAPEPEPEAVEATEEIDGAPDEDTVAENEDTVPVSTLEAIIGGNAPPGDMASPGVEDVELSEEDMEFLSLVKHGQGKKAVPVVPDVAPHEDVRRFAARVLGDIAEDDVARALACVLGDPDDEPDDEIVGYAADSLARIGEALGALPPQTADALLRAAATGGRDRRLPAVRALAWIDDRRAEKALRIRLRDDDGFVRAEAVRALARKGRHCEAQLDDADAGVRLAAAGSLVAAPADNAIERLVDLAFVSDGLHRREAGRLLRRLDPDAAAARFLDVLADPERQRFRPVAIEALEELYRPDVAVDAGPMVGRDAETRTRKGTS